MIQIVNKAVKQAVYFPKGVDEDFGEYSLVLTSELTLKKYEFDGLEDISNSNRYLKFELDFSQMDDGEYNYYIPGVGTGLLRIGDVSNSLPERYNYAPLNCCCDEIIEYYPNGNFKPRYQDKDIYIDENGNYRVEPDSGYTALNSVNIEVNVTGYTEDDLHKAYDEGVEDQKAKLIPLYVTESGTYTREDGFNPVEVNIVCPDIKYYQLTVVVSCDDMSEIQGLIGKAKVVITYDGKTIEEIFDGSPMNFEILPGVPFRVDFSEVDEYTKPSSYSATSTWDGQETVNGVYQFIKPFHLTVDVECDGTSLCDTLVNNAYVTVFYGSESTTLLFDGDPLPFTLPGGYDYTVRFSPVDGFNTPANITGTSTAGASEIVAGQYTTKPYELYVDVECDGSSLCGNLINEAEVTVTYGSESITKTYEGNVLNFTLPGDVSYTVSFSNVTNFNTPARITGTSTWAGSRNVSGQYTTKYFELNVDVTCDDAAEIQGLVGNAVVFVSYDGHDVTQVYDGTPMTFNLPGDVNYTVSFIDVEDYDTPQSYTGTSVWGTSIDIVGTYIYNPPYDKMFVTVVVTSENTGSNNALYLNTSSTAQTRNVQVKVNNGEWQDKTFKYSNDATNTIGGLSAGDKIKFKGLNNTYFVNNQYCYFNSQNNLSVNVEGNIMSLIYGDDFKDKKEFPIGSQNNFMGLFRKPTNSKLKIVEAGNLILPATALTKACYSQLFMGCTSLVSTPELPATQLANNCYDSMFNGCTSLTTTPELPATELADACYQGMFYGCSKLENVQSSLPATVLAQDCYTSMFHNCKSLTDVPELPATQLAVRCYQSMFNGCTALVTAPVLESTTLANNCYQQMFYGCTSLVDAPELPATALTRNCYNAMFYGCTSLVDTPELNATTIPPGAYRDMFNRCTSLVTAPELPATTVNNYSYSNMFEGCTKLVNFQSVLPATNLGDYCYESMFQGCTSLTTAPELPATEVKDYCYRRMFNNCTNLENVPSTLPATTLKPYCYTSMFASCKRITTPPSLPATELADFCYFDMFNGCSMLRTATTLPATIMKRGCYMDMFRTCTSITTAPLLPSVDLAERCYEGMFRGCSNLNTATELPATKMAASAYTFMFNGTSITTAPELPATELADACYNNMFGSTNISEAPELPVTELAPSCYKGMFSYCKSLVTAPVLPATTLVNSCYRDMFYDCGDNLNYVKCLATDISATDCTLNWLYKVSSTGTFVKNASMSGWTTGVSGIPSGWTVQDA